MNVGLIATPPITSVMTENFGWESCFYMVGSLTCIWFAFWAYYVHNSPEEHPRISKAIKQSIWLFDFFLRSVILGRACVHKGKYHHNTREEATHSSHFGNRQDKRILGISTCTPGLHVGQLYHVDICSTLPKQHPTLFTKSCEKSKAHFYIKKFSDMWTNMLLC